MTCVKAMRQTISRLHAFLAAMVEVSFGVPETDASRYDHIVSVTQPFDYARLNQSDQMTLIGIVRRVSERK